MADVDIWFSRHNGDIWGVVARHGEAPRKRPGKLSKDSTIKDVLRRVRKRGDTIIETGIVPPDMIGLE